jgi:serine protease
MRKLTPIALATVCALAAGTASAERVIISTDTAGMAPGIVKKLAVEAGGAVKVEGRGFLAADFQGKSLADIKGMFKGKNARIELDHARKLMAYSDDAGNPTAQQLTPYAVYQSQANQLTLDSNNYKKVCVVDSGIAGSNGETGGKNNDFDWNSITGTNDSGTGNWNADGGPHGTHVAGTVAAADNGFGVIGMAPGNPLHIVKVFNAAGWGYSSDLAKAAQDCAAAGSDIITMSLGGGGANSTEENAFANFTASGGLVLAAAGNDGNTVRSFPAGYASVMMIGANDANNAIASFSQFPSNTKTSGKGRRATTETNDGFGVEVSVGGVNTLSTYPSGGGAMASLTADGVGFSAGESDNKGTVTAAGYHMGTAEVVDSGAAGKVCVIDRGNISFADKLNNCDASGGVGAIVINNVAGEGVVYMDVTGNTLNGPAVGAAYEDRSSLINASSITISAEAGDYGYMSGTSMATPGAAGIAALLWSNHPTCSGTEIREAMKSTAEDQGASGRDDYFGYGIVKAAAANAYLTSNGCTGGTGPGPDPEPEPEPTPCKGGPKKCG